MKQINGAIFEIAVKTPAEDEDGKKACRKYFTFCKQGEYSYCKFVS